MPSTKLTDLDPRFRPIAEKLLQGCRALEPMRVIYTLRTPAEQADAVARGASITMKSKHLAQPCCGKAHAIDIAPVRLLSTKNWSPLDPVWEQMREVGRILGLKCDIPWDKPHYEWSPPPEEEPLL